uniref:Uncharacterized protein n=1 Tax=Tanacetum cinerariifolium TaxID=118510 RepID=A0A699KJE5_TANCI|nr:hypothetical protein [Tanacetum cinerariifolium]
MYYPRFTKAIIHHFITKDKSISMRNIMFMHTTQFDSILGPMRFVSKSEDFQRTFVTIEEEEPKPSKKVVPSKKPATRKQSIGVQIRDTPAALLEEAQLKKALKRRKQETSIHQADGSSEGVDFESEVPDEPKGKSIDTSEGTGLKPGVPDLSKGDSSESEYESWGDNGDEANIKDNEEVQDSDDEPQHADDERTGFENQETNDDDEETEDEFVHTPPNYAPTDDESNDVTGEEYERINEELYGDVDISLTDAV